MIRGGSQGDTLRGEGGNDRLFGDDGDDLLVGGFEFWVAEYMAGRYSLTSMSVFFTQSPEFEQSYGDPSNLDFVRIMYRNVLGREAEPKGRAFWLEQLAAGTRDRGGIMAFFSNSPEHRLITGTS